MMAFGMFNLLSFSMECLYIAPLTVVVMVIKG